MDDDNILAALAAPFPPDAISWRVGSTNKEKTSGMALAYIDARDVQDRLDQVCGVNWQVRHPWSVGTKLACEIGILINGEWHWRGDGAGDSDVEAEKGAFSDSFKRAAVRWGVGRYLYDLASPWVDLKPSGRSFAIADKDLPKLRALLARNAGAPANPPANSPKAHTAPQTEAEPEPWRVAVRAITAAIDTSRDLPALNSLMDMKGFISPTKEPRVGSDLEFIRMKSVEAYDFLVDRANKRRSYFMQAPADQRKAS